MALQCIRRNHWSFVAFLLLPPQRLFAAGEGQSSTRSSFFSQSSFWRRSAFFWRGSNPHNLPPVNFYHEHQYSCNGKFMVRFSTLMLENLCECPHIYTEQSLIVFKSGHACSDPDYTTKNRPIGLLYLAYMPICIRQAAPPFLLMFQKSGTPSSYR